MSPVLGEANVTAFVKALSLHRFCSTCIPTTCQLHMAENSFTLTTYVSLFKANTSANRNAVCRQIWQLTSCCCWLLSSSKSTIVRPRLKKPHLDASDLSSYRPISNLSFVSKILERIIDSRFTEHADLSNLLSPYQSAYRKFHSSWTRCQRGFSRTRAV